MSGPTFAATTTTTENRLAIPRDKKSTTNHSLESERERESGDQKGKGSKQQNCLFIKYVYVAGHLRRKCLIANF